MSSEHYQAKWRYHMQCQLAELELAAQQSLAQTNQQGDLVTQQIPILHQQQALQQELAAQQQQEMAIHQHQQALATHQHQQALAMHQHQQALATHQHQQTMAIQQQVAHQQQQVLATLQPLPSVEQPPQYFYYQQTNTDPTIEEFISALPITTMTTQTTSQLTVSQSTPSSDGNDTPEQAHKPPPLDLGNPDSIVRPPCAFQNVNTQQEQMAAFQLPLPSHYDTLSGIAQSDMINYHHQENHLSMPYGNNNLTVHDPSAMQSSENLMMNSVGGDNQSWYMPQSYGIGPLQTNESVDHQQLYVLPPEQTDIHQSTRPPPNHVMCPVHKIIVDNPTYKFPNQPGPVQHSVLSTGMGTPVRGVTDNPVVDQYIPVVPTTCRPLSRTEHIAGQVPLVSRETGLRPVNISSFNSRPSSVESTSSSDHSTNTLTLWPLPPSHLDLSSSAVAAKSFTKTPTLIDAETANKSYVFASNFQAKRMELDFTPEGVAQQINIRYSSVVNPPISGNMVELFESGALPTWEMDKMMCFLEKWLIDTERARGVPEEQAIALAQAVYKSDRRKRTYIDSYHRFRLEQEFQKNCRPNRRELQEIVRNIGSSLLNADTIRVWFCNRRMKMKTEGGSCLDPEKPYWPKPTDKY